VIASVRGEVLDIALDHAVIEASGVGYKVMTTPATLATLRRGTEARLITAMIVREDSMTLYGFATTDERELFDLLTGVTGVGPKVGLAFLSALQPEALRRAVIAGDADTLTVVPGVGKKVAQRVVLDLRDKLGGEGADVISIGPLADVREALLALGLTSTEAAQVMTGIDPEGKAPDDLLREALQKVGR